MAQIIPIDPESHWNLQNLAWNDGFQEQNIYNLVCCQLTSKDLSNFSYVSPRCAKIVERYNMDGRIEQVCALIQKNIQSLSPWIKELGKELGIEDSNFNSNSVALLEKLSKALQESTSPEIK